MPYQSGKHSSKPREVLESFPNIRGVFWTKYINFMCATFYQQCDPEFKLDFTKKLESMQYSAALAVTGAWRGTNTDRFAKMLAGKSLTTESGIDACVTFINCGIIRDHITYILKYDKNVSF